MDDMDTLEVLIGHTIEQIGVVGDMWYVKTDSMCFEIEPDGECCAKCYVADVDGADALSGGKVLRTEDLAGETVRYDEFEVVETWGHRIITDRGICTIGMRVEHNGYYGGELKVRVINGMPNNVKPLEDFSL